MVTKFFQAYTARLKNAYAASSSNSFHFYSVSGLTLTRCPSERACKH